MKRWWIGLMVAAALPACSQSSTSGNRRAEVRAVGPTSVQIVPASGQLPYCLVFTASERKVIRQLTMPPDRQALPCPAGQPIGGLTYRIPAEEGKVRIYVLFSDQQVKADPIAAQIYEVASTGRLVTAMDLRAPGKVQVEALEFTPSAGEAADAVQGDAVTRDAGAEDAGAASAEDAGAADAGAQAP